MYQEPRIERRITESSNNGEVDAQGNEDVGEEADVDSKSLEERSASFTVI